jgi:Beta-propeller repeat
MLLPSKTTSGAFFPGIARFCAGSCLETYRDARRLFRLRSFILLPSGLLLFLVGCGGSMASSGGNTSSGTTGTPLNLPAAHTQAWVQQIQNQVLPPQCPTASSCSPTNQVNAVATDSQGDAIIAGTSLTEFAGAVDFAWNHNGFVAKFDPTGKLLWTQQFGPVSSAGFDDISSVVVDSQGNSYAGGMTTGAFPGYTNPDSQIELILAKLDPNGNLLWVQQYQTGLQLTNTLGESIALTPKGQVAFGWTSASTSAASGNESFLYLVDPVTAMAVWQKSYPGQNEMMSLSSTADGNLIGVGVSMGAFPGSPTATVEAPFVVEFDGTTGTPIWQQAFSTYLSSTPSNTQFMSSAEDTAGDVLVGGASTSVSSELCEGLCDLPSTQGQSAIVAKLNGQTGEILWIKDFSTGEGDGVTGVAADPSGDMFAVGFTNGSIADGFTQPTENLFALKLSSSGTVVWAQQFGTGSWMQGLPPTKGIQAVSDASGNLFVAGETESAFPGISNPTNLGEAFAMKFGP